MHFTQKIKYNLKHAIPMLAIAGAGMMASCDKDDDLPMHDVEIKFSQLTGDSVLTFDILQKHIDDPSVRNIYMVAEDDWTNFNNVNITETKNNFFRPRIEMSKKMHGRGDFNFKLGEASKVPTDSLWFVKQGWTINKRFQNQR